MIKTKNAFQKDWYYIRIEKTKGKNYYVARSQNSNTLITKTIVNKKLLPTLQTAVNTFRRKGSFDKKAKLNSIVYTAYKFSVVAEYKTPPKERFIKMQAVASVNWRGTLVSRKGLTQGKLKTTKEGSHKQALENLYNEISRRETGESNLEEGKFLLRNSDITLSWNGYYKR